MSPPRTRLLVDLVRLGSAATAVAAMAYQYASISDRPAFDGGNFFSFFTIQSNILAAAMLGLTVIVRPAERGPAFDALRGAWLAYLVA